MRSVIMIVLSLFVLSAFIHAPEKSEAVNVVKPKTITGSSMPVMNSGNDVPQQPMPTTMFPPTVETSAPLFNSLFNTGPKAPAVCGPGMDCEQRGFAPRADRISTPVRGRFFNGRVRGFFARFGCRGC